jgi:hypothetical protein
MHPSPSTKYIKVSPKSHCHLKDMLVISLVQSEHSYLWFQKSFKKRTSSRIHTVYKIIEVLIHSRFFLCGEREHCMTMAASSAAPMHMQALLAAVSEGDNNLHVEQDQDQGQVPVPEQKSNW